MYHYLLEPNDVLSFRDGKPFGSADDHNVMLDFPPSPATFYGALRGSILAKGVNNFKNLNGLDEATRKIVGNAGVVSDNVYKSSLGSFEINCLLFHHRENGLLYPMPADLVLKKKADKNEKPVLKRLSLSDLPPDAQFNLPAGVKKIFHSAENEFVEGINGYLTLNGMKKYLSGGVPDINEVVETNDVYIPESRVGIGRSNKTRTVRTGSLFTVEFARLCDKISFYVKTNHKPGTSTIKLGGEGRSCKVTPLQNEPEAAFEKLESRTGVTVTLLTPLFSEKGWQLEEGMIKKLSEATGVNLQFEGAALRRHRAIGGWDIVLNRSKTMRRYLAEGSVFYFKSDKNFSITPRLLNLSSSEDDKKQGFGLTLLGGF